LGLIRGKAASYLLPSQGYSVNLDLPGEERPDTVERLEAEISGWAAVRPE
jgi:hypothetical protein